MSLHAYNYYGTWSLHVHSTHIRTHTHTQSYTSSHMYISLGGQPLSQETYSFFRVMHAWRFLCDSGWIIRHAPYSTIQMLYACNTASIHARHEVYCMLILDIVVNMPGITLTKPQCKADQTLSLLWRGWQGETTCTHSHEHITVT